MQPWEFVIVEKPELRKKIIEITDSYWQQSVDMEEARPAWQGRTWKLTGMTDERGDYTEAPVYILLCGDPRTQTGLPMGVQSDTHRRWLIHQSGLANAFLYMHLAATTLGLASQWYSVVQVPYAACMIKKVLGIPAELEIYDMMVLGYPAVSPPGKFIRDVKEMVHWDKNSEEDFRDNGQVKAFVKKTRNWTIGTHSRKAEE
jgi:nitroreductase